jgi:uncharacterized protein
MLNFESSFMKKATLLLTFLLAGIFSFAQTNAISVAKKDSIPATKGWTSDFEGIYTTAEVEILDSLIGAFEKKTSYEIVIITVDSTLTTDDAFDNYITSVANAWGVGKKGKDNGIVIGISSAFGRIRIVNGAGVVEHISDEATKVIIDTYFIPNFKEGNYFKGTKEGLLEIMKKLN